MLQKAGIIFKADKRAPPNRFDIGQMLDDSGRRRKILRQCPFKRIVPEAGSYSAESLFDGRRASQYAFSDR
jgi:hypothetical protein